MSLQCYHTPSVIEVGLDEAGRGTIFGSVYAAAVIWPQNLTASIVKDSKKYTKAGDREKAYDFIVENAVAWGVAEVNSKQIDETNIYKAVMQAMHQAINHTYINPDHIIVDGNSFKPYLDQFSDYTNYTTIIAGDNKYYSIAAASVIAKVTHDREIHRLCHQHPILNRYSLSENQGYGTQKHIQAIQEFGITQYHRKSFKCCQNLPIQYI